MKKTTSSHGFPKPVTNIMLHFYILITSIKSFAEGQTYIERKYAWVDTFGVGN